MESGGSKVTVYPRYCRRPPKSRLRLLFPTGMEPGGPKALIYLRYSRHPLKKQVAPAFSRRGWSPAAPRWLYPQCRIRRPPKSAGFPGAFSVLLRSIETAPFPGSPIGENRYPGGRRLLNQPPFCIIYYNKYLKFINLSIQTRRAPRISASAGPGVLGRIRYNRIRGWP